MKQPSKMHRPTAVLAAIFMILSLALNIAASLSDSAIQDNPIFMIQRLGNVLITVMLSIILFRGRKDSAAGVVLLLTMIASGVSVAYYLLSLLLNAERTLYILLCALSGFVLAAFRGLSALECLSPGKISASGMRVLLRLLPILCFCVELWAYMLLCLYDGMNNGEMITSGLIYAIPQWIGPILMGVALSVPGKE